MKILLSCQGGFSSSLVVSKMKEEAQKRGLDATILTVDQGSIVDELDDADILMLSPQIIYVKAKFEPICQAKKIPLVMIPALDYGRCNGKNILDLALKTIQNQ